MSPTVATAPARAPQRTAPSQPHPDVDRSRRHLRSVQEAPPAPVRSGPKVHIVLGVGVAGLFAVLFAVAVLQTVLVQGQIHLDGLQAEVAEAEVEVQTLRAEVGQLESPGRVVDLAAQVGMVPATDVQSVVPDATGSSSTP
jgi:cell division protein FtsL